MTEHIHISRGVSKLGTDIPSVNLPPVVTCRKEAPCYKKCYARKGRFSFSHNKQLLQRNYDVWRNDPEAFENDVRVAAWHSRFFRWHSSGDIPDEKYLDMMVRIAKDVPETRFLAFTKKCEMINEWIRKNGDLPENLSVVFSAWGSIFIPENPYQLSVAYVNLKDGSCKIPEDALRCPKYCGDCVMTGCSCWDLKKNMSVVFNEH